MSFIAEGFGINPTESINDIYLIRQLWLDPLENNHRDAIGYRLVGFAIDKEEANSIIANSPIVPMARCWAMSEDMPLYISEKIPRARNTIAQRNTKSLQYGWDDDFLDTQGLSLGESYLIFYSPELEKQEIAEIVNKAGYTMKKTIHFYNHIYITNNLLTATHLKSKGYKQIDIPYTIELQINTLSDVETYITFVLENLDAE